MRTHTLGACASALTGGIGRSFRRRHHAGVSDDGLDAGDFSRWLTGMQRALRSDAEMSVPCNGCTACCRSSQFVHIDPDETGTLGVIPPELLFPAPRLPRGHVVLGYDERGHCPLLVDDACSIYEHRPRACRTYDCRVFAATGLALDDPGKEAVADRAGRWRFTYATAGAQHEHEALRAEATHLRDHHGRGAQPTTTQLALRVIEMHDSFS